MLGQSELSLLIDPRAESKVFQGITTEVTGEGGSAAPFNDYILKESEPFLKHFNLTADWHTLGEYFARLERSRTAINLATYVGATQVRQYVLHDENRAPTPVELDQMRKQLGPEAKEFIHMYWQERLKAARRVFNDPAEVEGIVELLEAATPLSS
jgi:dihydroorotase/N-acyl-D-amino-acid deacylase